MPVEKRYKPQEFQRKLEPLDQRKKRQSIEAAQAMADYIKTTEAARNRLARLRAERLEREASGKSATTP